MAIPATEVTDYINDLRLMAGMVTQYLDEYPTLKERYTWAFNAEIEDDDFTDQHTGLTEAEFDAVIIALDALLVGITGIANFNNHKATVLKFARGY